MSEPVIRVESLGKKYQLGTIGYGTLRHDLQAWFARIRGKEDPNQPIGEKSRLDLHGDFWAVKDINFEVRQGERIGIIGRNGAGKSTLLKILSQITRPTEGVVRMKGRAASLLEVGTGFHPELTGRENVFLNGAIMGMKRREIEKKFDEIVEFSGVEQFIDTPVKRYSSGMYVRLGFAVAAYLDSDILLIDEVLAVGDAEFQKKCIGKMNEVSMNNGKTILFVTHNLAVLNNLCTRGFVLDSGRKIFENNSIDEAVHYYLQRIGNAKATSRWENNAQLYENPSFQPLEFAIRRSSDGAAITRCKNDEDIYIEIRGRVEKPHRDLIVGINVINDQGTIIFQTHTKDIEEQNWPRIRPGVNRLILRFPKRLLNEGVYRIELLCFLYQTWEWIVPLGNEAPALELTIYGGMSDSPINTERRKGILALMLPWELLDE